MRTNLVGAEGRFMEETYAELLARYTGFGSDFYARLKQQVPEVFEHLLFYYIQGTPEDSFALYEKGEITFAIQVDQVSDCICLWNPSEQLEFGHWCEDAVGDAIAYLKEHFI